MSLKIVLVFLFSLVFTAELSLASTDTDNLDRNSGTDSAGTPSPSTSVTSAETRLFNPIISLDFGKQIVFSPTIGVLIGPTEKMESGFSGYGLKIVAAPGVGGFRLGSGFGAAAVGEGVAASAGAMINLYRTWFTPSQKNWFNPPTKNRTFIGPSIKASLMAFKFSYGYYFDVSGGRKKNFNMISFGVGI